MYASMTPVKRWTSCVMVLIQSAAEMTQPKLMEPIFAFIYCVPELKQRAIDNIPVPSCLLCSGQ
jgi:hypothetical protein